MQTIYGLFGSERRVLELPGPEVEVLPGVPWGAFDHLYTPAFWASQVWLAAHEVREGMHRLGSTLREELAACLLGGYGLRAEVGLAAYARIRDEGLLDKGTRAEEIFTALSYPLPIGDRKVGYRFPRSKAKFLAESLAKLDRWEAPDSYPDREYRDWLATFPGVGLKTASWITRNRRDSDEVAILDIHIWRACCLVRLFPTNMSVGRHYLDIERRFLEFAHMLGVRVSLLDSIMWNFMRQTYRLAVRSLPH